MKQEARSKLTEARQKIKAAREKIVEWNRSGVKGWFQVTHYTKEVDRIIRELLVDSFKRVAPTYSVVALGGYGRKELNLCSDLDIMFLWDTPLSQKEEQEINELIQMFWDLGIDIGHSYRSVDEALKLAAEDDATKCSYLDARLLGGSLNPFIKFIKRVEPFLFKEETSNFLEVMENWLKERYTKYSSSMYLLEPNIKESPGCLRDIHTVFWTGKKLYKIASFSDLKRKGLLTPLEYETLQEARDFFWRIRNVVHFKRNRKNDVLSIDIQPEVAYTLGYRDTEKLLGVEYFMRDFYNHARNVQRVAKAFMVRTRDEIFPSESQEKVFIIRRLLEERFETPADFIKEVKKLQEESVDFDQLYRGFWVPPIHWREKDLYSEETKEALIELLNLPRCFEALKFLHEIGFIERMIPEFGKITGLMQFDLYHKFTVDEHTLLSIKNVEELADTENLRTLKKLYLEVLEEKRKYLLVLALLLHDIGKGKGKGHAARGARIAAEIMSKMKFSDKETEMVIFLVKYHTIMTEFALRRDLSDPKAISAFAEIVGGVERLKMLYLLTYGDTSAVGPDVWNDWKAALLEELYIRTLNLLEAGDEKLKLEAIDKKLLAQEIWRKLNKKLDISFIERELDRIPEKHLVALSTETTAEIIKCIRELKKEELAVTHRIDELEGKTELIVVKYEQKGDFTKIVGTISSRRMNIQSATVISREDGIVIYVIEITDLDFRPITHKEKLKELEKALFKVLKGEIDVEDELKKKHVRLSRRERVLRIEPKVTLNNYISDRYSVIEVKAQDRLGLLYEIAKVLSSLNLYIHMAKVSTEGNRAVDTFYVTKGGGKIKEYEFPEIIRAIKAALTH